MRSVFRSASTVRWRLSASQSTPPSPSPRSIKYPALDLAYDCLRRGGTAGCTMNGANEVAVAAFLARRCGYLEIVRSIEYALGKSSFAAVPSLGDLGETNAEARCLAAEYLRL